MKKPAFLILLGFVIPLFSCSALAYGQTFFRVTPDNAIIFIDEKNKLYVSPQCLYGDIPPWKQQALYESPEFIGIMGGRYREINGKGYNILKECKGIEFWWQEERGIFGSILEKVGVLDKKKSRWNEDGTWNW